MCCLWRCAPWGTISVDQSGSMGYIFRPPQCRVNDKTAKFVITLRDTPHPVTALPPVGHQGYQALTSPEGTCI